MSLLPLPHRRAALGACLALGLAACGGASSAADYTFVGDPNGRAGAGSGGGGQAGSCQAARLSDGTEAASDPAIAMDLQALPVVSWTQTVQGVAQIYVKRSDGTAWAGLGASARGNGVSLAGGSASAVAVDGLGRAVLAWGVWPAGSQAGGGFGVMARRYAGTTWADIDGAGGFPGILAGGTSQPAALSLVVDDDDVPSLVWQAAGSSAQGPQVYAMRDTPGAGWAPLGAAAALTAPPASQPAAASGRGSAAPAFVAYVVRGQVVVVRVGGGAAVPVGGALGQAASNPQLVVDGGGQPWVAYEDSGSGNDEVYVAAFNGRTWAGPGGAVGGDNVSHNAGASHRPTLGLSAAGRPRLSWDDDSGGRTAIFLRFWDGTTWDEIEGSATGVGISRAGTAVLRPRLAVGNTDRLGLTWQAGDGIYACTFVLP